ncbi:response regulator [Bacillus tianshenii]|nr:response regulator [Bacillus tianshenii]
MSILIVDDVKPNVMVIERALKLIGYQDVLKAYSAEEAFQLLGIGSGRTNSHTFELIFLDILMPGLNGIEACTYIREDERYRETPIFIVTAFNDSTNIQKAKAAGANDYLTKPINMVELKQKVLNVFDSRQ